jgi:hypothetical protein
MPVLVVFCSGQEVNTVQSPASLTDLRGKNMIWRKTKILPSSTGCRIFHVLAEYSSVCRQQEANGTLQHPCYGMPKKLYHVTTWYVVGLYLNIKLKINMATMSTRRVNEPTQSQPCSQECPC